MRNINDLKLSIYESSIDGERKTEMLKIVNIMEKTSEDLTKQNKINAEDINIIKKEISECRENISEVNKLIKEEKINEAKAKLTKTHIQLKQLESLVDKCKGDISINGLKALKSSMGSFVISVAALGVLFKKINTPEKEYNSVNNTETNLSKHDRKMAMKTNVKNSLLLSTLPALKTGMKELTNENWKNELKREIKHLMNIIKDLEIFLK